MRWRPQQIVLNDESSINERLPVDFHSQERVKQEEFAVFSAINDTEMRKLSKKWAFTSLNTSVYALNRSALRI